MTSWFLASSESCGVTKTAARCRGLDVQGRRAPPWFLRSGAELPFLHVCSQPTERSCKARAGLNRNTPIGSA